MTETMACRGPDDSGTWIGRHAALGHRRLAIIDLPGGRQPMAVEARDGAAGGGSVAMVYSGEAYNFAELREELARRGHRFTTDSDTEVVLHGYLEWGGAVSEHLNGVYAFAVWDERFERLVMIRDRIGIKPLYYYPTPDGVLFGSEPKAILANPLARARVGLDGLREMFALVKTPRQAVWDGMFEVAPGTVVTLDRNGLRSHAYWTLETREHTDSKEQTIAHVRTLLDDIVRRQLVADVPRCVLLSGGLDSSTVTALAARQLGAAGEQVNTFAVDFVGQEENFVADEIRSTPDTPFVHDVARESGTEHQDIVLDAKTLADPGVRARVIGARDLPLGLGDLDASLYSLFKAIRVHSTVALSGESADELFGGYRQFFSEEARKGKTFPWLAQSERMAGSSGRGPAVLRAEVGEALKLPSYIHDRYTSAVAEVERLAGESDFEYRMRVICYLHLTRFVRVLLDRKDRMSMAVGLEVRVPFCDHRLVEYVYNAPWALKSFDGREKSLLREAAADVLPRSVYERVKSPYPSTQDPLYAVELQKQVKNLLSSPSHRVFDLVDRQKAQHVAYSESDQVSRSERSALERTLNLALWLDMYKPEIVLS
jgi:asparagine synthase (glutamine-hydrolysing)